MTLRKTKMDKLRKFLAIVQALGQEFRLVERDNLNDNTNSSFDPTYSVENQKASHLIGKLHRNEAGTIQTREIRLHGFENAPSGQRSRDHQ